MSDQPDDRDEKRKRTKPETGNDKPDRKKPVPIDSEEGSGSDHGSDQEEEAKKDIGSGGGEFGRIFSHVLSFFPLQSLSSKNVWLSHPICDKIRDN